MAGEGGKKRISRACDACHKRKVKCNGELPRCWECSKNDLKCTFECIPKKRGRKPCRVELIREEEQKKKIRLDDIPTAPTLSPVDGLTSFVGSSPTLPVHFSPWGHPTTAHLQPLPSPVYTHHHPQLVSLPPISVPHVQASQPLSAMSTTSSLQSAPPEEMAAPRDQSPSSSTQTATHSSNHNVPEPALPPMHVIEYFAIHLFFRSVYPIFPLVHGPTIRTGFASGLFETDKKFSALILSMCAIAASQASLGSVLTSPETGYFRTPREAGETFFHLALSRRGPLLVAEDTIDVQITYFLGQYCYNFCDDSKSWHYLGEAIRMGLGLNLHVQREDDYRDYVDREVRRRLMWQLFVCDKSDALTSDRPMLVRSDEISIPYATEVDDEYITPTFIHPQPGDRLSLIVGFNAITRLWKLFEELILNFRADRRQMQVLGLPSMPGPELRQNLQRGLGRLSCACDGLHPALEQREGKVAAYEGLDVRVAIQRANLHVTRECMLLVFHSHYSTLLGSNEDSYVRNATITFKGQTAGRLLRVLKSVERDDLRQNGAHLVLKVRLVAKTLLDVIQLASDPLVVAQASRDLADYLEILARISVASEPATSPQALLTPITDGAKLSGRTGSPQNGQVVLPPSPPRTSDDPAIKQSPQSYDQKPTPPSTALGLDLWSMSQQTLNDPPFWATMIGSESGMPTM